LFPAYFAPVFLFPERSISTANALLRSQFIPAGLRPDANMGKGMKKPKNVENPQNDSDHDDGIQNRLDRPLHRNKVIDKPKQNTHDDQNHHKLNQGHRLLPPSFSKPQISRQLFCFPFEATS
jgi:hypothetical protein